MQDQITERVVGVVEPSLKQSEIERSRRKPPENLEAYDLYLRAVPHMASVMPADAKIAMSLLEQALKLDPNYPAAHAFLAWCHEICFMRGGFDEADKKAGLRHAHMAIASGSDDATTLAVAALVIAILSKDHKAALSAIERALSLNPSSATAHYWGAIIHASSGNSTAATAYANRALRLSPFDPVAFAGQGRSDALPSRRRATTRPHPAMLWRCKPLRASTCTISFTPQRWPRPDAWRRQGRLSNNCSNSIRAFRSARSPGTHCSTRR